MAANMTGTAARNEYSVAVRRSRPATRPPMMVEAARDTPGPQGKALAQPDQQGVSPPHGAQPLAAGPRQQAFDKQDDDPAAAEPQGNGDGVEQMFLDVAKGQGAANQGGQGGQAE